MHMIFATAMVPQATGTPDRQARSTGSQAVREDRARLADIPLSPQAFLEISDSLA